MYTFTNQYMNTLSDKRLLTMCLVSAVIGFTADYMFETGLIVIIAIAVFTVLMLVDGYVATV